MDEQPWHGAFAHGYGGLHDLKPAGVDAVQRLSRDCAGMLAAQRVGGQIVRGDHVAQPVRDDEPGFLSRTDRVVCRQAFQINGGKNNASELVVGVEVGNGKGQRSATTDTVHQVITDHKRPTAQGLLKIEAVGNGGGLCAIDAVANHTSIQVHQPQVGILGKAGAQVLHERGAARHVVAFDDGSAGDGLQQMARPAGVSFIAQRGQLDGGHHVQSRLLQAFLLALH